MKKKFNIIGMACSACSSHVEKAVSKVAGVNEVSVNLLTNSMLVDYDENKTDNNQITEAVVDAGYEAFVADEEQEDGKKKQNKLEEDRKHVKTRLIVSVIFLIPLLYLAMYHMIHEWFGLPIPDFMIMAFDGTKNALIFAFTQLLLLVPIVISNQKYFISGYKNLIKATPNMDTLIAVGSTASIAYGIFAIYRIAYGLGNGVFDIVDKYRMDLYFESAGTILTLITVGKYLETKAKGRTSDAITKLINLAPKTATIIIDNKEVEVLSKDLKIDDTVIVKPGQVIPTDGIIIEGSSSIDESTITGEGIPVEKFKGSKVIGGTINKLGSFKFRVEKTEKDNTLSKIINLVEDANSTKSPIAKMADKISGIFVPVVITIAFVAFLIWLALGQNFEFALSIGIAVLVISCPCALGLATPVAIMVGTGKGAENGILIKSSESLEIVHKVDTIVLDKTGTITSGKPEVTDILTNGIEKNDVLKVVASIEQKSEHPLAEAIVKKAKSEGTEIEEVTEFSAIIGKGIKGKINQNEYYIGNDKMMNEFKIDMSKWKEEYSELQKQGKTILYCSNENEIIGIIAVTDKIKQSSITAVKKLKQLGIYVLILTGDNKKTAEAIKEQIMADDVIAELLPQDKEAEIRRLQEQGKIVAMVGDGINDSPALARADVGIAIGAGTDIAIESADIVLIKNSLEDVVTTIRLSKATIRNIKENLFWAFLYNTIGIPIAAGILFVPFGITLNPMIAAAAMSLSSVCVVLNALRLKLFRTETKS